MFVPRSHRTGSLGSSSLRRIWTGVDDRLVLVDIATLKAEEYWSNINAALADVDLDDRDAIVFIHGYNVSFSEAALRAAQLGYDLGFRGAMTFFSWPSQGELSGYLADSAAIEASERALTEFLVQTATLSGARSVHVIAHSMGNRGLLRAVNRITSEATRSSQATFAQVILAAADVDVDTFRELSGAYSEVSKHVTIYVSSKDQAVQASGKAHQFQRIGFAPPVFVTPGFDTVDVADVDLSVLGHGYVAEAREVLNDMHAVISYGTEPARRFGLRQAATPDGLVYWTVK